MPWVAVIVVNWNDAADTIACLDSLRAVRAPDWRAYVVDNASSDGSPERILAAHPAVSLVAAPRNLGYAGAFNLGRQRALDDGAAYLWLLNNDVCVDVDALAALVAADRQWGPAIYSPCILHEGGQRTVWYAGGWLDWRLKSYHVGQGASEGAVAGQVRSIAWATGCSLFCSAAVARRVGPMDERYFLYLEDVDWSLTARAAGAPIRFVPAARLVHGVSRSVRRIDARAPRYYAWRNYYLLVQKHGRWWQRLYAHANLATRFLKIGIRSLLVPASRHDPLYTARTRGLIDYARGVFGECRLPAAPAGGTSAIGEPAR